MIRKPVVAGQFYPGSKEALENAVREYLDFKTKAKNVIGLAAPHAGYVYSGATAGRTYASALIPKRCVVLAPNHTGMGADAAIMSSGEWMTPLGKVPIDQELAAKLMKSCDTLREDPLAHVREHSLEVQLPFLQERQKDVSIVPICIKHLNYDGCEALGKALAKVIKECDGDVLIVASTDMNHYESQETTTKKDNLAIENVLTLDPKGLLNTCGVENITMCGVIPTAVMLIAAKGLGAHKAELVEHTTSGDVSGDYDAVVGYAGFIVY